MTIFRTKRPDGSAFNYWYAFPGGTTGTQLLVDQTAYFVPLRVERSVTFDRIGIEISTAAGAGGVVRFGLYADAADSVGYLPGALITDYGAATVTTGATVVTVLTPTAAVLLSPTVTYWVAVVPQGASAPQVTVRTGVFHNIGLTPVPCGSGTAVPVVAAAAVGGLSLPAFAAGALPTTLFTNANYDAMVASVAIPRVFIRTTAG